MRLALIGYGAVAGQALRALAKALPEPLEGLICFARAESVERARAMIAGVGPAVAHRIDVVTAVADVLARKPAFVAEAASQAALLHPGADVLSHGYDLVVSSVGGLARALRITWPGRPKTCMGVSCRFELQQPEPRRPPSISQAAHICLIQVIRFGVHGWADV